MLFLKYFHLIIKNNYLKAVGAESRALEKALWKKLVKTHPHTAHDFEEMIV